MNAEKTDRKSAQSRPKAAEAPDRSLQEQALYALRKGDFDFAMRAIERGETDFVSLMENLKIYQAELEIQNEELRQSQIRAENAAKRFAALFDFLPLPALVVDEMGVVRDCNEEAMQRFKLRSGQLGSHFFPRFFNKSGQCGLRRLLDQAKEFGNGSLAEQELRTADGQRFVGDIYVSLLPSATEKESAQFAVLIVDQTRNIEQRQALEASRRHFMAYFNGSPVGMAATNPEKEWLEINDTLCDLLGYRREELIRGISWETLTHPDDLDQEIVRFHQVLDGEIDGYALNKRLIHRNGAQIDVHVAVQGVRDRRGKIKYFVGVVEDLGARKRAERALAASQDYLRKQSLQLRKRVKELSAIYAISRLTQEKIDVDEFVRRLTGLIPPALTYPEDVRVLLRLRSVRYDSNPDAPTPEFCLNAPIVAAGTPIGEIALGYLRSHDTLDIGPFFQEERLFLEGVADLIGRYKERIRHERKIALDMERNGALLELIAQAQTLNETELVDLALKQAEMLTGSRIAYLHFVEEDQTSVRAGAWYKPAAGLSGETCLDAGFVPRAELWLDCLKEKRLTIQNELAAPVGPERRSISRRHIGVPVLNGDDVVMVVGVCDKPEPYDDGDIALLQMIANNAWALLQRNRAHALLKLDAEVFRHSREGVMVTDAASVILNVNAAFSRITGYDATEAKGQKPNLLKSDRHDHAFYRRFWEQLSGEGYWQGEIWNRRKNGQIYPQWLSVSAIKGSAGEVMRYIAIFMDISDYKQALERIEFLANHDPLTGLPNRALLRDRFELALNYAKRENGQVCLLLFDLDHFKNINDSLGHPAGDRLLVEIAARLKAALRDCDTVCRLGGDEFVIMLTDIRSAENLHEIAKKILATIEHPFEIQQTYLTVTCSLGVALYPGDGEDFDTLLRNADTALYQAKATGRNNFQYFTEEMNRRAVRRMELDADMRRGLERGEFYLAYQPQFDLSDGQVIGAEALLRWEHPQRGNIPPAEFVPIAEDSGFIMALGDFVLRTACAQAKRWLTQGRRLRVAANISSVQFNRNHLIERVFAALRDSGLPEDCLELELTESILVSDSTRNLTIVETLRNRGIHISIDDFGTGYSSLSYLKRFAVNKLKIDQSFVRQTPGSKDDEVIIDAIVKMAQSLGIDCIAEGIETEAQLEFLRSIGCTQGQGYLLAKPLRAECMDALLHRSRSAPSR